VDEDREVSTGDAGGRVGAVHVVEEEAFDASTVDSYEDAVQDGRRWGPQAVLIAVLIVLGMVAVMVFLVWCATRQAPTGAILLQY
jgi:hypothetical protein